MEQIAVIRLAPGQVGYYDELSRIHLTIGNPERAVYAGTNCSQLRKSVKSGRLRLISGSLGEDKTPIKIHKPSTSVSLGNFIPEKSNKKETKEVKETVETKTSEMQVQPVAKQTKVEDKKANIKPINDKKVNSETVVKKSIKNNTQQESK